MKYKFRDCCICQENLGYIVVIKNLQIIEAYKNESLINAQTQCPSWFAIKTLFLCFHFLRPEYVNMANDVLDLEAYA